jgi:putative transcriptional regulator
VAFGQGLGWHRARCRTDVNFVPVPILSCNFTRHFLIAMPGMSEDSVFSRTLTYICEHNENGALGLVVNRPRVGMTVGDLFNHVELQLRHQTLAAQPVYYGGPVHEAHGFVLHRPLGDWKCTLRVDDNIGLTTSKDILESLADGGTGEHLIALGYAGWASGQLEHEVMRNDWLTVAADPEIIFSLPPEERLPAAMRRLGVSYSSLSDVAGHA